MKPIRELVPESDLRFGRRGPMARLLSGLLMRLGALDKLNRLYDATFDEPRFAEGLLRNLSIRYEIDPAEGANLPASGASIVVSNHPTGALDGVLLIDALSRIRPDVKFLGNFLLARLEPLRSFFIEVDPFDAKARSNVSGMREAMRHLQQGGMLVIFPAGEVATWRRGVGRWGDKPWGGSIVRFIRRSDVPVIPLWIEARNSLAFHLLGKVHPLLRTGMLPRELLNKRGKTIPIRVGSPLLGAQARELDGEGAYGHFLRANVEYLAPKRAPSRRRRAKKETGEENPVAEAGHRELLLRELEAMRVGDRLFSQGDFEVFLGRPGTMPHLMREIGRLREITFREIGEGTRQAVDTDRFDRYYHQLFIWDKAREQLVGAYRVGFGPHILGRYGLKGFYTYTLFRMKKPMGKVMGRTMELGRSFIRKEYQRKPVPLMLLWKGILSILLRHEELRYLCGPVSISGEYRPTSKLVMAAYLLGQCLESRNGPHVKARTGVDVPGRIDASLIRDVSSLSLINKLVSDSEGGRWGIPILIRKYLDLGARVLALNTDHDFSDSLDALILVDLKHIPQETILMLSKEMTDIDVIARFRQLGTENLPPLHRQGRRRRRRNRRSERQAYRRQTHRETSP